MLSRRQVHHISIHSLRMEGDQGIQCTVLSMTHFNPLPPHGGRLFKLWYSSSISSFQSTPSAWRETSDRLQFSRFSFDISIHSLRMEGDPQTNCSSGAIGYFNPLPPHGGRQQPCENSHVSSPRIIDFRVVSRAPQ